MRAKTGCLLLLWYHDTAYLVGLDWAVNEERGLEFDTQNALHGA